MLDTASKDPGQPLEPLEPLAESSYRLMDNDGRRIDDEFNANFTHSNTLYYPVQGQ